MLDEEREIIHVSGYGKVLKARQMIHVPECWISMKRDESIHVIGCGIFHEKILKYNVEKNATFVAKFATYVAKIMMTMILKMTM